MQYCDHMEQLIGVLSDIHANVWALEAVLEDARRRGVAILVNLGDSLWGPLAPRATYNLLLRTDIAATIRGNQDRMLWEADPNSRTALPWVLDDLGAGPVNWLRTLPAVATLGDDILLCHGTPSSDSVYLLEEMTSGRPPLRRPPGISKLLGNTPPVILCGHTHVPRCVRLPDGRLIVNPGSVGLPAHHANDPVPHVMESYSPHAQYATLDHSSRGWNVSLHRVPYDFQTAAKQARQLKCEDWARGLESGWMIDP